MMKQKLKIYYSRGCGACPPALRVVNRLKEICGEGLELEPIDIETPEGKLKAIVNNVEATPTIDINEKVRITGSYPGLGEDVINAIADSPNIKKRVVKIAQLETGEVCRFYVDEDYKNRFQTHVIGSDKCKKWLGGET